MFDFLEVIASFILLLQCCNHSDFQMYSLIMIQYLSSKFVLIYSNKCGNIHHEYTIFSVKIVDGVIHDRK